MPNLRNCAHACAAVTGAATHVRSRVCLFRCRRREELLSPLKTLLKPSSSHDVIAAGAAHDDNNPWIIVDSDGEEVRLET